MLNRIYIQILVTQEILDNDFLNINKPSADTFNRGDQYVRANCDFTVLEFIDVTDRRHPVPVDPMSKAFSNGNDSQIDKTKIEIGGNVVDLEQIKKEVAWITSQDKEFILHQVVSLKNKSKIYYKYKL